MAEKENKKVFENIKTEVKEYYSGKNMTVRYVILGFLVILLVIQFIIPHNKKLKNGSLDKSDNMEISQGNDESKFNFLGKDLYLSKIDSDTRIKLDKILKKIQNDLDYNYTFSQYYLPEVYKVFNKHGIPVEFSHIAILNNFQQPYRQIEENLREYYGLIISSEIDETLNVKKVSEAMAMYLLDLYKKFKDWDLVLIAYFMGSDELENQMNLQGVKTFDDLYITNDIKDKYLQIMAYAYIFQNLDEFVDLEKLSLYQPKSTTTITLSETKDLIKRARKNKYSYKEIKELNPRILGNSLPKGKREIIVNN